MKQHQMHRLLMHMIITHNYINTYQLHITFS